MSDKHFIVGLEIILPEGSKVGEQQLTEYFQELDKHWPDGSMVLLGINQYESVSTHPASGGEG